MLLVEIHSLIELFSYVRIHQVFYTRGAFFSLFLCLFEHIAGFITLKSTYRSHKWVDEARPNASSNISDWQNKSSGRALLVRHVGQGQVGLSHADG